jgi:hypothetical protein
MWLLKCEESVPLLDEVVGVVELQALFDFLESLLASGGPLF